MQHEAVDPDPPRRGGGVQGVLARGPENESVEVRADLVVGCATAAIRSPGVRGGMELQEFGAPIDVLWFRMSRRPDDPEQVFGHINYGRALILIDRGEYFQAGLIIPKGSYAEIQSAGIEEFRSALRRIAPFLKERADEVQSWDQIKVLTVQLNRLRCWHREGLLCIGDAAHAMSPAGGVGINLAIQDKAVATANLLAAPLRECRVNREVLAQVQRRRQFPTKVTQGIQALAHRGFQTVFFAITAICRRPGQFKLAMQIPGVHLVLGYVVGIGVRPEHVGRPAGKRPWVAATAIGIAAGCVATLALLSLGRRKRWLWAVTQYSEWSAWACGS